MNTDALRQYSNNAASVNEIIAPLRSVGIIGVFYVRIYPDGTIINIANDANWVNFYFKKLLSSGYQNQDVINQFFIFSGTSLWELNAANPVWQDAKQYFGYGNGVLFVDDNENYREAFSFYSTIDNHSMNHFYINQLDTLKKMKQYFLSQSAELIQEAEHERLLHQHLVFPTQRDLPCAENNNEFTTSHFITPVCVSHNKTGLPVQLSAQRSQCLQHLMHGKSAKEIARAMNLASKTVEHYLEFLRKELGCRSSKELILSYAHQII